MSRATTRLDGPGLGRLRPPALVRFDSVSRAGLCRLSRQRLRPRARPQGSLVAPADLAAAAHHPAARLRPEPSGASGPTGSCAPERSASRSSILQGFTVGLNGWTSSPDAAFGAPGRARRHGHRRGADRDRLPDPPLPRACGPRLVPRRCVRRLLHRHRHRADRRLRLLPGLHHPAERRSGQPAAICSGRVRGQVLRPLGLGISTACVGPALRRCLEHAVPRDSRGFGTTALGLAFALIATRTSFRFKKAAPRHERPADHHAALRDRPRADPAVRPLGRRLRAAVRLVRHPALALDLRPAGRPHRAAPRLHADRLPRAHRRRAGHQPDPRGSVADAAGQELDDLPGP